MKTETIEFIKYIRSTKKYFKDVILSVNYRDLKVVWNSENNGNPEKIYEIYEEYKILHKKLILFLNTVSYNSRNINIFLSCYFNRTTLNDIGLKNDIGRQRVLHIHNNILNKIKRRIRLENISTKEQFFEYINKNF